MRHFKVGVQLHPQHTSMAALRQAARDAEVLGVDSLWTWDHFYPLSGDADDLHFEGWTTLTAFAADTTRVTLGHLVTCNSYRNPHLLVDMARTVDHIAGGRVVLGVGAGWFKRDYDSHEYAFGTPGSRLRQLEADLYRMARRKAALTPPPVGDLPLLIGGGGERVTLRLVAQHADLWNGFADSFPHKNQVLDRWCDRVGRDPAEIERTALAQPAQGWTADRADDLVEAGAQHIILGFGPPFDPAPVEELLARAER